MWPALPIQNTKSSSGKKLQAGFQQKLSIPHALFFLSKFSGLGTIGKVRQPFCGVRQQSIAPGADPIDCCITSFAASRSPHDCQHFPQTLFPATAFHDPPPQEFYPVGNSCPWIVRAWPFQPLANWRQLFWSLAGIASQAKSDLSNHFLPQLKNHLGTVQRMRTSHVHLRLLFILRHDAAVYLFPWIDIEINNHFVFIIKLFNAFHINRECSFL